MGETGRRPETASRAITSCSRKRATSTGRVIPPNAPPQPKQPCKHARKKIGARRPHGGKEGNANNSRGSQKQGRGHVRGRCGPGTNKQEKIAARFCGDKGLHRARWGGRGASTKPKGSPGAAGKAPGKSRSERARTCIQATCRNANPRSNHHSAPSGTTAEARGPHSSNGRTYCDKGG